MFTVKVSGYFMSNIKIKGDGTYEMSIDLPDDLRYDEAGQEAYIDNEINESMPREIEIEDYEDESL